MCVLLRHFICGNLLQLPEETNTAGKGILVRGKRMHKSRKWQHIEESPEKLNVSGLANREWRKLGLEMGAGARLPRALQVRQRSGVYSAGVGQSGDTVSCCPDPLSVRKGLFCGLHGMLLADSPSSQSSCTLSSR